MLTKLDQYFEEILCTLCLAIVATSVMLQVVLRFFFESASSWAEETAVFGMIFAVYLGASMGVRDRAHIRITLLINAMPRAMQVCSVVLADLLWAGFILFMIVQTSLYTKLLFEVTYISPGLGIEIRWLQLIMPFSFVLILFRILQVYWRWKKDDWRGLPL
ncbi:MAG: TRAP transporter small permease [Arenicella sp.]